MTGNTLFFTPGNLQEKFITLYSDPGCGDFAAEAADLLRRFQTAASGFVPVWLKFHLSDVTNQAPLLQPLIAPYRASMVAVIGQAPLNNAHIALESWLLPEDLAPESGVFKLQNYTICSFNTPQLASSGSFDQMTEEFDAAKLRLATLGGNLAENLQRTWIYCRDVDNNYAPLVVARRELFERNGLSADTHYIASTGIEGSSELPSRLVRMDSLALFGHRQEQISYLRAIKNLSPTNIYGVTFERGTRIIYGDRSHYYISGTASIDCKGNILYENDVRKQCERVLENMAALLAEGDAKLADLKQITLYLRDSADYHAVREVVQKYTAPETQMTALRAPVCRPGWLVEIEGIAVNSAGRSEFKPFV